MTQALEEALAEKNKDCLYQRAIVAIRDRQCRIQALEAELHDRDLRECEDCKSWSPEAEFVQCSEDGPEICKGCYESGVAGL